VVGRKGLAYYRYHQRPVALSVPDVDENVPFSRVSDVARDLMERFERKEIDGVEVISTRTKTRFRHEVTGATLLPYRAPPAAPGTAASGAAAPGAVGATRRDRGQDSFPLVEPGRTEVLARLLPLLVEADLLCLLLEAMSCEQAERSLAMRSASDSADAMTKQLTRTYNRARQAQITNEMIEIISGSEGGRA
jgi:F-type H+-transporting ATPase subunit gamma